MTEYRWNAQDAARAFDAAAESIHPHYIELQDQILQRLAPRQHVALLVVDAGGGSGRLMERVLELLPKAQGQRIRCRHDTGDFSRSVQRMATKEYRRLWQRQKERRRLSRDACSTGSLSARSRL